MTTQVQLTWTASAGATQYEVVRGSNAPVVVGTNNYTDNTVTAGNAYLYKVRALDASSRRSPDSAPDLATTFVFTDDPVVAQTTQIKAIQITQLRQAVNAVRAAASLGSFTFTDISPTNIKAVHIAELRSALGAARTTLGLASQTFTDPALTPGATVVKAAHVQELRAGVK
jgi:fibronectin type 3 domain-containing protein